MTKYMISFPSAAMVLSEDDFASAVTDSHAVVQEIKDAGAWVFGGGINEDVDALLVAADGTHSTEVYPETRLLNGGLTIIEVATRDEAVMWASKIAAACRCAQELREFYFDPES